MPMDLERYQALVAATSKKPKRDPEEISPFDLPGLTRPLDWEGNGGLFPTALTENFVLKLTALREFEMLRLMDAITDKEGWEKKVFDDSITTKWKAEAKAARSEDLFSEKMGDWVISCLQEKAKFFEDTGCVVVYNADVVKSDKAVPEQLKQELREAVSTLENIPAIHRDWHPGSDEKVLDLVHPSLFPLMYGRSRALTDGLVTLDNCLEMCGKGDITAIPDKPKAPAPEYSWAHVEDPAKLWSNAFQWLPCEVKFNDGQAKISSYINNLHPVKHQPLYSVIEKLIDCAIPLWNITLDTLRFGKDPHIPPIEGPEYLIDRHSIPEDMFPPSPPYTYGVDEWDQDYYDRKEAWWEANRKLVYPEPNDFENEDHTLAEDLKKEYAEDGIQVIVKLANIHLTPEKPSYDGGSWHVEGQMNEHIVATALYYYDSVNITESRLSFRQSSETEQDDWQYEQGDDWWLEAIYGCTNWSDGLQEVGSISCRENRLLTFPNILQHRVDPFKLADPTKPGHRKIVALFLVDPNLKIASTANIPPQQRDWWAERLSETSALGPTLPQEVVDNVVELVEEFPVGMADAKKVREMLMEERKNFVTAQNEHFAPQTFSLCEH